jgi:hypothetical protein
MNLTTQLNLMLRFSMSGTIPPLVCTDLWHENRFEIEGAWLGDFYAVISSTFKMEAPDHQHSSLPFGAKTFFIMSLYAFIHNDQ